MFMKQIVEYFSQNRKLSFISEYFSQSEKISLISEYLLTKSSHKTHINHEIRTFENEYKYSDKCDYELPLSELYKILISNAKIDDPGASDYEKYENVSRDTINDEEITIEGCKLLGVRCLVKGHDKTYDGTNPWWDIVKTTANIIYEIFEYFQNDIVKIQKKSPTPYPEFFIIFPNNEVISTFCYNMGKDLKQYKVKNETNK